MTLEVDLQALNYDIETWRQTSDTLRQEAPSLTALASVSSNMTELPFTASVRTEYDKLQQWLSTLLGQAEHEASSISSKLETVQRTFQNMDEEQAAVFSEQWKPK